MKRPGTNFDGGVPLMDVKSVVSLFVATPVHKVGSFLYMSPLRSLYIMHNGAGAANEVQKIWQINRMIF